MKYDHFLFIEMSPCRKGRFIQEVNKGSQVQEGRNMEDSRMLPWLDKRYKQILVWGGAPDEPGGWEEIPGLWAACKPAQSSYLSISCAVASFTEMLHFFICV